MTRCVDLGRLHGVYVGADEVAAHLANGWTLADDLAEDGARAGLVMLAPPGDAPAGAGAHVVHLRHCVDRGSGERAGQFAITLVRRWLRPDGEVAMVARTNVGWCHTEAEAAHECARLDNRSQVS